jgi:hypothetical protein
MTPAAPLLLWLMASGGLRVETGTPEALCPDIGQVRAEMRARLGDIEAQGNGDWLASYTLVHRPDATEGGDIVRLQLTDPAGRLRLRRDLVRAGESCAALARAVVVVLDAYFRHPAPAQDDARDAQVAVVNRTPVATATATATRTGAAAPAPAAEEVRLALDLSAAWAGGWAGGGGAPAGPALALGLRLAIVPSSWWVGLEGAWMLSKQSADLAAGAGRDPNSTASSGTESASLRSLALRGFVARDLTRTDRLALLVGPEILLELDQADGAALRDGSKQTRASWGGGARGQFELRLARRAFVSFVAAVDYGPEAWGGTFVVQTATGEQEIFPTSHFRLLLGAGLGLAVF